MPSNFKRMVTCLVILIIFILLSQNILQNWQQVNQAVSRFGYQQIVLLLSIGVSLHLLNSLSWHFLTKAMNLKISLKLNLQIWMLPNISRYIPGIVWQYMGRIYMLNKLKVNKNQSTLAVALDAIFTFSIGCLVTLLTLRQDWILVILIPIPFAIAFFFSNQRLLTLLLFFLHKFTKKVYKLPYYKFISIWLGILSITTFTQFIVAGFLLFSIASVFTNLSLEQVIVFAGVYAGSWILGYISFFAPGGLGVQELSITGLLSFFMPVHFASLTAIIFRFTLTFSEGVVILLILFFSEKKRKDRLFQVLHKVQSHGRPPRNLL